MIKYIMTDLDGVLRYFPSERDREIENSYGLPIGTVGRIAFEFGLLEQVIKGEISDETWREKIVIQMRSKFPTLDCTMAINTWSDFPGQVDHQVLEYLKQLSNGRKLVLLTNATSRLLRDLDKIGLKDEFDQIFNSSAIGQIKPSKEIFQYVLADLNCHPSEIIFIDDSKSNVMASELLGIRSFHFRSLKELRVETEKLF